MQHVALRCAQSLRRIHLVACAALRDAHCDAIFRGFPRVDELVLDACDWVTDDGLLPLLAATGAQLRSLRLAHWVGAVECTELPLQVLGDTLAAAAASDLAVLDSTSSSSSTSGCRLESLHLIDMSERMLPDAVCARLLSQLPAQVCVHGTVYSRITFHLLLHAAANFWVKASAILDATFKKSASTPSQPRILLPTDHCRLILSFTSLHSRSPICVSSAARRSKRVIFRAPPTVGSAARATPARSSTRRCAARALSPTANSRRRRL
jgi:hypothetical protein